MSELRFVRLGREQGRGADAAGAPGATGAGDAAGSTGTAGSAGPTRYVDYLEAWEEQRRVHAARFADEIPDTCLLLEHLPVYTAGRRTADSERPLDGTPVIDVDRGGKITWHGPGQLVGYPIMKLPRPVDVIAHVRRLEEALIRVCAEFGLETTRVEGRSGVWVLGDAKDAPARAGALGGLALDFDPRPRTADDTDDEYDARLMGPEYAPSNAGQRGEDRKLAAIGIRVAKGVTMHGFSLNVNPDNTSFDRIVPCGIRDAGVTSLANELGRDVTVDEVLPVVEKHLRDVLKNADPQPRAVESGTAGAAGAPQAADRTAPRAAPAASEPPTVPPEGAGVAAAAAPARTA